MTDKKISQLPEITTPATSDIIPVVDVTANTTKKITAANLSTFINNNFPAETIRDTIGGMLTGNTETDITVTHDDPNDKINFVVSVSASNLPSSIDAAKIANGNVSNAEFETLDGVTSGIQTQINTKLAKGGDTMTGVLAMGNNAITTSSTVDGRDVATDGSKLDGIETGATADQTASEIRTLVESATDSNVFTDADHTKLNAIEASATADQTNAEIRTAVEAASDSNVFTDADHTKLNGIEASADVTDATNVTAAGALMDSELANVAAIKGINQALTTTSSPTFAGITGPLTGNASTASALGTARTINLGGEVTGSASFDGSSDITITGTIAANSIGINELALNDGSNGQFIQTNGSGTISFASAIGSSVINNSAANRITTVNTNTSDFDAESNLTFDGSTLAVTGDITVSGTVDGADVAAMSTKLSGIEASSTADQTDAEIRAAVEAATDSNVFTDADHTKLNGIEASATADQTASEIRTLVGSATDSNVFTDALLTKLNGVETSADVTDATNVTAAGALMDSEVTNLAQVKAFSSADYATAAQGTLATNALPKAGGTMTGTLKLNDNVVIYLGTGDDLQLKHDGSNSFVRDVGAGDLIIEGENNIILRSVTGSEKYIQAILDGGVVLYHNDTQKISTTSSGGNINGDLAVTGTVDGVDVSARDSVLTSTTTTANAALPKAGGTMTGDLILNDNVRLEIGSESNGDLAIYHDGSHSYIDERGTGDLYIKGANDVRIQGANNENLAIFGQNSSVYLYHDNTQRAQTNSSGFAVTGELTCTGNMTASGNVTAYSDERLKTDIKTIDNALDKVSQMRGVTFTKDGVANSGVIAQEMEKVAPELVKTADDEMGTKSVAYGNTVGYLIEAIKELKAEVADLKCKKECECK